jgi:hypothetical protein
MRAILHYMIGEALPVLGWMIEVGERRLGRNHGATRRYCVAIADESAALRVVDRLAHDSNPVVRSKRKITDPAVLRLLTLDHGKLLRLS